MKILAIDDHSDNLMSLQAVLKDALPGCELFTALNGADGIQLAHAEDPDVILLDIVMPGMDGYAVCQALKGDDRSRAIPVVFLTALRTDRASRMKALDVGADGFLAKPLDEHELVAQIRTMAKVKVANRLQLLEKEELAVLVVERTAQLESAAVALRASEARYRSVFTDSRVVKLLIDPVDGRIVEGNRAACEYYGWDQAQLQTMCIQDINTLTAEDVLAEMEQARLMGKTHFDFRHRLANGDVRDVEVYSSPLPAAEPGGRVLLHSIVLDVTERQRVAEALRRSESLLQEAQRIARVGSWEWDVVTNRARWSREMFEVLGVSPDGFDGTPDALLKVVHPDDRARFTDSMTRNLTDGSSPVLEYRVIHPDGSVHNVLAQGKMTCDAAGHPIRSAGTCQDVTERKQVEEQLAQSHALLVNLARLVPGVIYQYRLYPDGHSTFPYASSGINTIYEVTPEDVQADATPVFGRLHPEDAERVGHLIMESARTLEEFYCEFRVVLPRQGLRWRWSQAHPERTADGGTLWHGIISDVTERKQADAARAALQDQLTQSQRMESIGLLAGGVAHDFNNQLAVILGYTELTMLKLGPEHEVHADMEEIHRAAQHSADLTRQLLAYARKQTLSPRVLDLNDAIDGMLKMLRRLLGERVRLAWTPASGLWAVAVDPTQVDQVLANLAVNAKSAMRDGDAVLEVSTANVVLDAPRAALHPGSREGEFVCLRVHDNGAGMDARTRSRIFEPFFTTKGLGEGTGLGLSTVQGIVEQHGGFVEVESTLGLGTTFHVYFPRSRALAEAITDPEALRGRGTETILLAEDEAGVRRGAADMLRMMGYTVLAAQDGNEAVALAAGHTAPIHLLLTDVIMPGMNGAQLRDGLLKDRPDLSVLFMSGYNDDVVSTEGVLEPGTHFVQKPFTMRALANAVRRALDD